MMTPPPADLARCGIRSPFSAAEWALIAEVCRRHQARSRLWHAEAMAEVDVLIGRHPGYNSLFRHGLVPRVRAGAPPAGRPSATHHVYALDYGSPRASRPRPIGRAIARALEDLEALCGPTRTAWSPEERAAAEVNGPLEPADPTPQYLQLAAALVRQVERSMADRMHRTHLREGTYRGSRYTGAMGSGVRYKLARRAAHHTRAG